MYEADGREIKQENDLCRDEYIEGWKDSRRKGEES